MKMFNIAILVLFVKTVMALSGSAAAGFCHCDLTSAFCDVNCCCDTDCSTVHIHPYRPCHQTVTI